MFARVFVKPRRYSVRLLRVAENDLADIMSFIAAENTAAAEALLDKIEKNVSRLERHPFLGRIPNDEELAQLGYCYLIVSDYLIFYTIQRKILIHRIVHGARNYKDLL